MILEADDLWVAPPDAPDPVVRGVSLRLRRGEWLGLAGPNGSGKTTLLLALAGLWPARRGSLRLCGEDWGPRSPARQRARVAMVMQEPASQLLASSVGEELEFALRNLGWPGERREAAGRRWSAAFELQGEAARDPLALSAGEQQRVLLAAALAAEPALLVCDEGGAHLDARRRRETLDRVGRQARETGMAVVWASQHPDELARADRVLRLGEEEAHEVRGAALEPGAGEARPPSASASVATAGGVALRARVGPPRGGDGPTIRVARGFELEVPGAGIVAVCGPNGVGKSVLLGVLCGAESCPQVECSWSPPPARSAAFAGQHPDRQLFADTVREEILFGALRRGLPEPRARSVLDRWLPELGYPPEAFLARGVWSLSAGERRLVAVAGALLAPASLVALDEPTVGLDAGRARVVARWVGERAAALPVLVATQDREWADLVGARVLDLAAI